VPRNAIVAVWTAIAFVIGSRPVTAQDVYVTLVHTHFSVSDSKGRLVTKLGRSEFTIYDNDIPQEVSEFGQRVDAALRVAVLLDRSRSVSNRFPFLRSAAETFASTLLQRPQDRALLVAFDSKVYLLQDWTADSATLMHDIGALTAAGGTSIFDAVFKTCRDKFDPDADHQNALVLVTDGEDTTSAATFEQALQVATVSRAAIYVIGVPAEGSLNTREWQGRTVLTKLADLTGGRLFYPDDPSPGSLEPLFARVGDELRNEYTLAFYRNLAPDSAFHRLRIEPKDKSLVVHAPSGYFARTLERQ
jgi:VWFA-related protein